MALNRSEIGIKIKEKFVSLLSPFLSIEVANKEGEKIQTNINKMLASENTTNLINSLPLLQDCASIIASVTQDLSRGEIVTNIPQIQEAILTLLNTYATKEESNIIAQNTITQFTAELKTEKEFSTIVLLVSKKMFEALTTLPARKQTLDPLLQHALFNLLEDFEKPIYAKYETIGKEFGSYLMETIAPSFNYIEMETKLSAAKEEAIAFIMDNIEPFNKKLVNEYDELQKNITNELYSQGLNKEEVFTRSEEILAPKRQSIKESINKQIDELIDNYCKDKSEEFINLINFDTPLKTLINEKLTLQNINSDSNDDIIMQSIEEPIKNLGESELEHAREDLRRFLVTALENNLGVLLSEESKKIEVPDYRLNVALFDFKLLIKKLPTSLQSVLLDEKYSADKVKTLDLTGWVPSIDVLLILRDPLFLPETLQYAKIYKQHLEVEDFKKEELLLLKEAPLDQSKAAQLIDAIEKTDVTGFESVLNKCSLTTLHEVLKNVTKAGFTLKDPKIGESLLVQLKTRINDFRLIAPSAHIALGIYAKPCIGPSSTPLKPPTLTSN